MVSLSTNWIIYEPIRLKNETTRYSLVPVEHKCLYFALVMTNELFKIYYYQLSCLLLHFYFIYLAPIKALLRHYFLHLRSTLVETATIDQACRIIPTHHQCE